MDNEALMKLIEELEGREPELIKIETEEKAISHARWAANLKPGDMVKSTVVEIAIVSPEGITGNRINLLFLDKKDGNYRIGSIITPISAIAPID